MIKVKYLFSFIFAVSLSSCNYNTKKDANAEGVGASPENKKISTEQNITYELVKSYSLKSSCLDCHSGFKAPNLTILSETQSKKNEIWHEVESLSMPPVGSGHEVLTGCAKELLRKWIDLGAPETSDVKVSEVAECRDVTPVPPASGDNNHPPPPEVTPILLMPLNYKSLTDRILRPKCLQCHSEKGEESDMSFYPYETLMEIERLWKIPAVESKIYKEITDKEDPMPPLDSKIPLLTDDEIEFVRRWIDAGKPEK